MPRSPRLPLLGALAGLLGLLVTGVLAYLVPGAHARDSATLQGFRLLDRPAINDTISHVAHLASPPSYALFGLTFIAIALARGRRRSAGLILFLLLVTGLTTHELKPLLASPRHDDWLGDGQIASASWPSGHATASLTLAFCAVIAVPARLRPTAAALGGLFTIGVSFCVLALGWHFPSDVFGGYMVAGTWTCLGVAALVALEVRRPSGVRRPVELRRIDALGPLVVGAGALCAAVAVAMARPVATQQFLVDHTAFAFGASAIALLALALVGGLARGLRTAA